MGINRRDLLRGVAAIAAVGGVTKVVGAPVFNANGIEWVSYNVLGYADEDALFLYNPGTCTITLPCVEYSAKDLADMWIADMEPPI